MIQTAIEKCTECVQDAIGDIEEEPVINHESVPVQTTAGEDDTYFNSMNSPTTTEQIQSSSQDSNDDSIRIISNAEYHTGTQEGNQQNAGTNNVGANQHGMTTRSQIQAAVINHEIELKTGTELTRSEKKLWTRIIKGFNLKNS